MKAYYFLATVAITTLTISSCRHRSDKVPRETGQIIHLTEAGIRLRDKAGNESDVIHNAKARLRNASGGLTLHVNREVKAKIMYDTLSELVRPADISTELILVGSNDDHTDSAILSKPIVYELPLADGNIKHWQYQVAELLENARTRAEFHGFDKSSQINYLALTYKHEGVFLGTSKVSAGEIIKKIKDSEFGYGRLAVGICIGDEVASVGGLLELMSAMSSDNCKMFLFVESKNYK